jgi:2-polyprenyl-3-methyl-5-hydroxy-6-metoxy-1,4-benzoquinol methylase
MKILDRIPPRAARVLRRTWMKYALRGASGADAYDRLELVYQVGDPWQLGSERERRRFAATNALIAKHFPRTGSLLEIGCGEGHQSEQLLTVCRELHGIDVSATAVERARERVPRGKFSAGDLYAQPWRNGHAVAAGTKPFDLVVACEVLYYMKDPRRCLDEMSALGKGCLVTFFEPAAKRLADDVLAMPGIEQSWFHAGGVTWLAAWWRPG